MKKIERNWCTVELGSIKTAGNFTNKLARKNCSTSGLARDLLDSKGFKKSVNPIKSRVKLALVSPQSINLVGKVAYKCFLDALPSFGFNVCPPEIGPLVVLERDSFRGEWPSVAMIPIPAKIYSWFAYADWDEIDEPPEIISMIFCATMTGGNETILEPSKPKLDAGEASLEELIDIKERYIVIEK